MDGGDTKYSLLEHWDGSAWSATAIRTGAASIVWGVGGTTANDVWVVGQTFRRGFPRALTIHWDGSRWATVNAPAPDPTGTSPTILYGVSAVAPDDVWAAGAYGGTRRTFAVHWDGSAWSQVATPNPGVATDNDSLGGIAAVATDDVWAVGAAGSQTLTIHWDGTGWSRVTSPNPALTNGLGGVSAVGPDDVWAVGSSSPSVPPSPDNLAIHWDGAAWSVATVPNPPGFAFLGAVSATATGEVFVAGAVLNSGETFVYQACGA